MSRVIIESNHHVFLACKNRLLFRQGEKVVIGGTWVLHKGLPTSDPSRSKKKQNKTKNPDPSSVFLQKYYGPTWKSVPSIQPGLVVNNKERPEST